MRLWILPILIVVFFVTTWCTLHWRYKVEQHYKRADYEWRNRRYQLLRPLYYWRWDSSWDEVQPTNFN
jgi:hypothetical protein